MLRGLNVESIRKRAEGVALVTFEWRDESAPCEGVYSRACSSTGSLIGVVIVNTSHHISGCITRRWRESAVRVCRHSI